MGTDDLLASYRVFTQLNSSMHGAQELDRFFLLLLVCFRFVFAAEGYK